MYITGHIEIVNDILSQKIFNNYFNKKMFSNFSRQNIIKGLRYVDIPCGIYEIENNKVLFKKRKLCNLTSLLQLYSHETRSETQIYQQHKGFFSHLHSMSTDPENNMLKIRNKIIISILGYSLLAIYDNNVFDNNPIKQPNTIWIGMIMHIITDSYSPAHTMRNKNAHYYIMKTIINDDLNKKIRLNVHEQIKVLAKQNFLYQKKHIFIQAILLEITKENNNDTIENTNKYIISQKKQLFNMYKSFKFEYNTNKLVRKMVKEIDDKDKDKDKDKQENKNTKKKEIEIEIQKEIQGDIVAFQYYEGQPLGLHNKLDFLSYIKNDTKLYKRMLSECTEYLLLYKEAIDGGDVLLFLNKVLHLLTEKTFHINTKYLQDKTNKIYYEDDSDIIKILKNNKILKYIKKKI